MVSSLLICFTDPLVTGDANRFPVEGFSGEFLEHILGRPSVEVRADTLDVFLKREVVTVLDEGLAHRFIDRPFSVENDSVKVKEDGIGFHV